MAAFQEIRNTHGIAREEHADYSARVQGTVPLPYNTPPFIGIGVVGVVSAGTFNCPIESPPEEYLPVPVPQGYRPSDVYGLRISGDCMEPTARSGEIAIIAKAHEAYDGQLCIVRVDGECTFKRIYRRGPDCIELTPDNPKFKPMRVAAKHVEIIGKVLWFYHKP